jgi:hypothetical protein
MARTNGQTWGRPLNPTESKYLLTGLLRCKHCGGGLHVSRQSGRRGQRLWLYYVCARQRTRGIPCAGTLRVRASVIDEAVLEDLGGKLMAPERIAAAVRRAAARLTAKPDGGRARRSRVTHDLRDVSQESRERRGAALSSGLGQLDALDHTPHTADRVHIAALPAWSNRARRQGGGAEAVRGRVRLLLRFGWASGGVFPVPRGVRA